LNPIVIMGCAPNWKDDLDKFKLICSDFDVLAVGLDCSYDGRIDYFATYHVEDIPLYHINRFKGNQNTDYKVISHVDSDIAKSHIDIVYPYEPPSGSSSLLGALASKSLGYKKIVLCGCPLEGLNKKKQPYISFQKGWTAKFTQVKGNVKSMSGWTRELLGEPSKEWLEI
jgi:hypothetical protein